MMSWLSLSCSQGVCGTPHILKPHWTGSPAQHRSQVSCDVDHRLLEVQQQPASQNHFTAPLDLQRLFCSQAHEKSQAILGKCSAISLLTDWDVPSALPPTVAAQAGIGQASRFPCSGYSCCIQPAPAQSTSRGDMDPSRSAAPQYSVFCKAPNTKNKENIKIYQKNLSFVFHFYEDNC